MNTPVFRLEGIVKTRDAATDFEGPLALILQLLSKNKIEVKDISISLLLEQYLAYLAEMKVYDLDVASEFVAMASHLAYIKTKVLLQGDEEVTELQQLISSLEELRRGDIYAQIKNASEALAAMYPRGGALMVKPPEYLPEDPNYPYVHGVGDLLEGLAQILGREDAKRGSINPRETVYPQRITYSVPEKISEILAFLRLNGSVSVLTLFSGSGSRTEIVATLIAVLELCKLGSILLTGEGDGILVSFTGSEREITPPERDFTEED